MIGEKRGVIAGTFLVLVFIFLAMGIASAQQDTQDQGNLSESERAKNSLDNMESIIKEMDDSGFQIERINDTLKDAKAVYEAQQLREERGQKTNYETVFTREEEAKKLRDDAFEAEDEIFSLQQSLEPLEDRDINVSEAESLINDIKQEVADERYGDALEIVPKARDKISELESESSQANVIYQATKNSIAEFFRENYLPIVIVVGSLILLYLIFRKQIKKFFLRKKLKKLRTERKTVQNLVKKAQNDYFKKGIIPEEIYNIRAKKYGEMIRDIDRRIPMINERIAKLGGKIKETERKAEREEEE